MAASTGVIAMWGFEPRGTRGIEKKERVVWLSARLKVLSGRPEHRGEARECDDIFSQNSRSHKHLVTNSCSHWPWIKSDK